MNCENSNRNSASENSGKRRDRVRVRKIDNFRVELDLSGQILRLHVPDDMAYSRLGAADSEPEIAPTLEGLQDPMFASAAMLAQKGKQVDDRIYASVELAVQQGAGELEGKAKFLKTILRSQDRLPIQLFAAAQLAELDVEVPIERLEDAEQLKQDFLTDSLRSKPIGFYTWNDELRRIFQQDRMLQSVLTNEAEIESLVNAIARVPLARNSYDSYLELVSRLTNPLVSRPADLRQLIGDQESKKPIPQVHYCLFPASRSHETELIKKLYGDKPIPDGFSLADELIRQIQAGSVALSPTVGSGWYDYQTWSLEPMVLPETAIEATRLVLSKAYHEHLLHLFKSILTLTRETHIKQLETPTCAMSAMDLDCRPTLNITPELSVEPLYSYYLRRAVGYQFLAGCLERHFGADSLVNIPAVSSDGIGETNLAEMLTEIQTLFYGAAVVVARELGGLDPANDAKKMLGKLDADLQDPIRGEATRAEEVCADQFLDWMKCQDDPDIFCDSRAMVPVFYDQERQQTKVWVFLGWKSRPVNISFSELPDVKVFDSRGKPADDQVKLSFGAISRSIPSPVMAEIYVDQILDRDEFRAHCDQHRYESEILGDLMVKCY